MALPAILAKLTAFASVRGGGDVAEHVKPAVNIGMNASMNSKQLERRLKQLEKQMPEMIDRALSLAAQKGAEIISDRASKGMGANSTFAPYSTRYASAKANGWARTASRSAFSGDPSGTVNLMVTGRMWGALDTQKNRGYSVIFFNRAEEAKKAFYNNKHREFMGFNSASKQRLFKVFVKEAFK